MAFHAFRRVRRRAGNVRLPAGGSLVVDLDPDVRAYYEQGREAGRLGGGLPSGPLEFIRTQELIERHLPTGRHLTILDVGGGPGAYAAWLAERGHEVHLVDPVDLHVEQARGVHPRVTVEAGDARSLSQRDASFDVVLLFGPLYHLLDRGDRVGALAEARRVLRGGGLLFAAAIARFAALMDLLIRVNRLHEPAIFDVAMESARTGVFRGAAGGLFTNAYFHLPDELLAEIEDAGFVSGRVFNVEGPAFLVADFAERWADPARRDVLVRTARALESEPALQAAGSHLLAVSETPS